MSNYTKATNFATKDALTSGNPLKTLSGTELDDEFNAIQTASATKANTASAQLTGVPVAPTAAADTNTTQLATTAFVTTEANLKADLAGAAFTGAITTTSTFDGVDIATRDGVLTTTTATADAALPKAGGALSGNVTNTATGSFQVAQGTTAQRDAGTANGRIRYNSTLLSFEGYTADGWGNIGRGGPSLGTDSVIRTNAQTISENITFAGTENGSSVGPITVAATFTVTVTSGSTWVIL